MTRRGLLLYFLTYAGITVDQQKLAQSFVIFDSKPYGRDMGHRLVQQIRVHLQGGDGGVDTGESVGGVEGGEMITPYTDAEIQEVLEDLRTDDCRCAGESACQFHEALAAELPPKAHAIITQLLAERNANAEDAWKYRDLCD